jgi:hypothetical protein
MSNLISHYIAHQLQQGANSIRISRGGKAFSSPVLVRAWAPAEHSLGLKNVEDLLVKGVVDSPLISATND